MNLFRYSLFSMEHFVSQREKAPFLLTLKTLLLYGGFGEQMFLLHPELQLCHLVFVMGVFLLQWFSH